MCLPNFQEFKQIEESNPIIGYRTWKNPFSNSDILLSEYRNYRWNSIEGPHIVTDINSGIYSYNYYNNNNNNNYDYYYNHNYYYYYDYNHNHNYYNMSGTIKQWGRVAIHESGYRSEYAKIDTLFSIRRTNAIGKQTFLNWIESFNEVVNKLAVKYNCKTITWQDFVEGQKQ